MHCICYGPGISFHVCILIVQVTGYVAMAGFCALALWIILTLIFKWNTYIARHMDASEFDEDTEK